MLIASQRDSVLGQIIGPNPRLDEEDNRLWLQIMISPPQRTANYDCNYSNEILKQKKKGNKTYYTLSQWRIFIEIINLGFKSI